MTTQFHVLSFEGPDEYAHAGGIATRVGGLCEALVDLGYETHLWFVGDPDKPGHQRAAGLRLHRWCQWISRHHPRGVYDGQDGKCDDYCRSLPPALMRGHLLPHLRAGGRAVILAEEWHTADAVLRIDALLRACGLRDRVQILWNANNTFEFSRIDWARLDRAAALVTVSRYMRQIMTGLDVEPVVVPNGLSDEVYGTALPAERDAFKQRVAQRTVLTKVARWDPDKRWLLALQITAALKREGWRPLLIARGGSEQYGREVLRAASAAGLRVVDRHMEDADSARGLCEALHDVDDADIVNIRSHMDWRSRRLLFEHSAAVLANSSHEPFGLVGLEVMATGGIACTGCSGEEYAIPGHNALVTQTSDPREFIGMFAQLRAAPHEEQAMRHAGRNTARQYSWTSVVRKILLPRIDLLRRDASTTPAAPA